MRRTLWPPAALAIVVMLAVISTGCGGGGGTSTPASHNSTPNPLEKAVKFSQCVRENGVSDFPDPGASGDFTIESVANGTTVDTSSVAFTRALTACKGLEPSGFTGETRSPEQQEAALEFAQCIRDHGVKDFPDPAIGQPLVDTNRIPSSNTQAGLTILNAAMQKCPAAAAGATGGQ